MLKIKTHAEDVTATLFKNLDIHRYASALYSPLVTFFSSFEITILHYHFVWANFQHGKVCVTG